MAHLEVSTVAAKGERYLVVEDLPHVSNELGRANAAIERVINDPSTSVWLANALMNSIRRDPVDADLDARVLADLLSARIAAMQRIV
jgi:hypothetical protein